MTDLEEVRGDWALNAEQLTELQGILWPAVNGPVTSQGYRRAEQLLSSLNTQLRDTYEKSAVGRLRFAVGELIAADTDRKAREAERELQSAMSTIEGRLDILREPELFLDWPSLGQPKTREWLIDGWLPRGRLTMFSGWGGLGKSRLALQILAALEWRPPASYVWPSKQNQPQTPKVRPIIHREHDFGVLASWEDEQGEVHRRINDISQSWYTQPMNQFVMDRTAYINLRGRGPLWAPLGISGHISTMGGHTDLAKRLRGLCEDKGATLLVIDSAAAAYGGDENARALVRAFLGDWDMWAEESGCTILLIGHPPKSGAVFSGSTDWHNAVRNLWSLAEEHEPVKKGATPGIPAHVLYQETLGV